MFSASDGVEAVAVFREKLHEIDIVILDVAMPGMNGHEAYREMQTIKSGTPVIFMTGYSLDGVQTNFILEEGFDVIQKPFTLISLGRKNTGSSPSWERTGEVNLPIAGEQ